MWIECPAVGAAEVVGRQRPKLVGPHYTGRPAPASFQQPVHFGVGVEPLFFAFELGLTRAFLAADSAFVVGKYRRLNDVGYNGQNVVEAAVEREEMAG